MPGGVYTSPLTGNQPTLHSTPHLNSLWILINSLCHICPPPHTHIAMTTNSTPYLTCSLSLECVPHIAVVVVVAGQQEPPRQGEPDTSDARRDELICVGQQLLEEGGGEEGSCNAVMVQWGCIMCTENGHHRQKSGLLASPPTPVGGPSWRH